MNNEELWKKIGDASGVGGAIAGVAGAGYAAKDHHDGKVRDFINDSLADWTEKEQQLYARFLTSSEAQQREILSRITEGKAYAFLEKFTADRYASSEPKSMATLAHYALVHLEENKQGLVQRVKESGFSGLVTWKAEQMRKRTKAHDESKQFLKRHEERLRMPYWLIDPTELFGYARKYLAEQQIGRDQLTTLSQYVDDNVMLVYVYALFFGVFSITEFLEFGGNECTLIDANHVNAENIDAFTALMQEARKTAKW